MLHVEDAPHPPPLFPQEAVDAAEGEFVAEPRPVTGRVRVALRPVSAPVALRWVGEGGGHARFLALSAFFKSCWCNRRASSMGQGATLRRYRSIRSWRDANSASSSTVRATPPYFLSIRSQRRSFSASVHFSSPVSLACVTGTTRAR